MRTDLVWKGLRTIINGVQEMQKSTGENEMDDQAYWQTKEGQENLIRAYNELTNKMRKEAKNANDRDGANSADKSTA